jgi:dihydrodipicolinate synthase/N-acetylneuraminate lyase
MRDRRYGLGEARAWALETLRGCCGCVMPTFTDDIAGLNESAIRHDVAFEKDLGMRAILLVAECGTTPGEYARFVEIAVDEAGEDLVVFVQASQASWGEMLATVEHAARAGADLVLPSYPLTYHPTSLEQVFEDTKAFIDAVPLGAFLFAIDQWNFARLHPAAFPTDLVLRLVEECPNLVGVKNEVGLPYAGGLVDLFEKLGGAVVVTDPMEYNAPIWIRHYGMRFIGTSNYECMGDAVPRMLDLLSDQSTWDEGMELYWRMSPVRRANSAVVSPIVAATSLVPRAHWKYQGWLVGFNGGPLRGPLARPSAAQMAQMRGAAQAAGLKLTDDPDELFWTGRNPA